MQFTIIREEQLKSHVDGLELFPDDPSVLKQLSGWPLSNTGEHMLPICSVPNLTRRHFNQYDQNNQYRYFLEYECKLASSHSSAHKIVFVKHYDHIAQRLAYVGAIEVSLQEQKNGLIDIARLVEKICARGSLLPNLDPKQMRLIRVADAGLSQLSDETVLSIELPSGSVVIVADQSVPMSRLESFPSSGRIVVEPPKPKSRPITELYRKMLDNEEISDLVLFVEDRSIHVSSNILILQSSYFRVALTGEFAENLDLQSDLDKTSDFQKPVSIDLVDLTYDGVMVCLEWMYTGETTRLEISTFPLLQQAYIASDYFCTEELCTLLVPQFPGLLNEINFGDAFEFATKYGLTDLRDAAVQLMKRCDHLKEHISGKGSHNETSNELIQKQLDKVFDVIQQSRNTFRMFLSAMV